MKPIHLDPQQRRELERRRHETHDRRLYERLSAVLWVADGKTRFEVADLLGCSVRQLAEWLRLFRNRGLDALCTLHHQGDPGNLSAGQVERLKQEISTGRFRSSDQIRLWVEETFRVPYTPSGIKDLLRRVRVSYHKVTGFLWKADPEKQQQFVKKYRRQRRAARRPGSRRTRFYFVDACHPIWGLDLVFSCWLLVGQRFLVGMGSGRKHLNILGAYCPDDREYLDLRLTRDNINGEQFVNLLRLLRATHPETERFNGGGRDHWSQAYSSLFAGGGIAAGKVVGRTDRIAGDVVEAPISPKDVLVTMYHLVGFEPQTLIEDRLGRPTPIAGPGRVRAELLG